MATLLFLVMIVGMALSVFLLIVIGALGIAKSRAREVRGFDVLPPGRDECDKGR